MANIKPNYDQFWGDSGGSSAACEPLLGSRDIPKDSSGSAGTGAGNQPVAEPSGPVDVEPAQPGETDEPERPTPNDTGVIRAFRPTEPSFVAELRLELETADKALAILGEALVSAAGKATLL